MNQLITLMVSRIEHEIINIAQIILESKVIPNYWLFIIELTSNELCS